MEIAVSVKGWEAYAVMLAKPSHLLHVALHYPSIGGKKIGEDSNNFFGGGDEFKYRLVAWKKGLQGL